MDIKKDVASFIFIVFLLVGGLLGVQISAFISGNLGPSQAGLVENSNAFNVSATIQNDTLQSLSTYSSGASTQMNTVSITITIALLIALFVFFMRAFIGKKGASGSASGFA